MTVFNSFPHDDYDYGSDEVGAVFGALIQRDVNGAPREGFLTSGDLITTLFSWHVSVKPVAHVSAVGTRAAIGGVSEETVVEISPAPLSGSRIDVVCYDSAAVPPLPLVDPDDPEIDPPDIEPVLGYVVVEGAPAASPLKPAVESGLIEVGTLRIDAGHTSAAQAVVTHTYQHSALAGQVLRCRANAELIAWAGLDGAQAMNLADGYVYERVAGEWVGGETTLSYSAPFRAYDAAQRSIPRLIVSDGVVTLSGVASTSQPVQLTAFDERQLVALLPAQVRPSHVVHELCQGSGRDLWYLVVWPDGLVSAARYGPGKPKSGANLWLPFHVSWPLKRR